MIKNLLQKAFTLKANGHYKHAIEVFYKALEEDCSSEELLLEIAELYFLMSNTEHALSYIEQILNNNPVHIDALKLLKRIFISKCAYNEAEQTAKNIYCISKDENDLAEIFRLLNIQQKYEEIFEYNINIETPKILYEQAYSLFNQKRNEEAVKILEKTLDIEPNNQKALLLLGKAYYTLKNMDECITIANKITLDEKNADMYNFLGLIEIYKDNFNKAVYNFNQAIKLDCKNSEYYFNLANLYFKSGDTSFAKKNYNLALSLNPACEKYHFALANLYYSEQHYKRALEELSDNFFEAKLLKAVILYDTGYLALARKELTTLEKERPDNAILLEYKDKIEQELRIS